MRSLMLTHATLMWRPAASRLLRNSSVEEDDMRAIMHTSHSGQQIQIEERCESCGFIGLHRLAQVCSSCGTQGSLTAVSRAARVFAAANRTGSSDVEIMNQLSPRSFLPPPRPAVHLRRRESPAPATPTRENSPQRGTRSRTRGSLEAQ